MSEASSSADPLSPLLKWPGGKRKLVPTILAAFPPRITAPLHERMEREGIPVPEIRG